METGYGWYREQCRTLTDAEIPAIILEESIVPDVEFAKTVNRTTRIISILVQAVEAAWLTEVRPG